MRSRGARSLLIVVRVRTVGALVAGWAGAGRLRIATGAGAGSGQGQRRRWRRGSDRVSGVLCTAGAVARRWCWRKGLCNGLDCAVRASTVAVAATPVGSGAFRWRGGCRVGRGRILDEPSCGCGGTTTIIGTGTDASSSTTAIAVIARLGIRKASTDDPTIDRAAVAMAGVGIVAAVPIRQVVVAMSAASCLASPRGVVDIGIDHGRVLACFRLQAVSRV